MADNVLVITDPATDEVLRIVVPDSDAQLETAVFHGEDEAITIIPMDAFLAYPDMRDLTTEVVAARDLAKK